jgi:hypothetical protein
MKKVLLASSALALVGAFASPASAAEWEMKVGGYMEQYVAYGNSDQSIAGDYDGIDSKHDSEIHFLPSITLDNGIKFGVNIQLEGDGYLGTSDTIDESYMFIKGSFGEILLGSENSAGYKMSYGAPDVTFVNVNSGSLSSFIPFTGASDVFRGTLGSTYLENARNNDANRFTYYTPRFSGFQVGVSYARDGLQDSNAQIDTDASGTLNNIFDIGANYVNSFGDFDIVVSGRYGIADDNNGSDPIVWATGLNLGYAGFTVGGSLGQQTGTGNGAGQLNMNGTVWDAGVSYQTGPWGFSFTYINGKNRNNDIAVGGHEKLEQYLLGMNYALATGVDLGAFGGYVDFNEQANNANDFDGWVIGTGIKLSF